MTRGPVHVEEDRAAQARAVHPAERAEPLPARAGDLDQLPADARGADRSAEQSIDRLQRSAGNAAVVQLLNARTSGGATTLQRDDDEDETLTTGEETAGQLSGQPSTDDPASAAAGSADDGATELDDGGTAGATGTGQSWTRVGPPKPTTYTVTGTLRNAAETVGARTEAGSVTTTPSLDTDAPVTGKDGTQRIPAARVTAAQVMELPVWSSREGPESNKGQPTANQEAEWNRFSAAIAKHEAGHVAKDKAAYAGADGKIRGKSPTDGDTEFTTITEQATTDNDTYDTATDHGRNEGTKINPNIDEVTKVP